MSSAWYHAGSKLPTSWRASALNIEHGPLAKLVRRGRLLYFRSISMERSRDTRSSPSSNTVRPVTAMTSSFSSPFRADIRASIQSGIGLTSMSVMAIHVPFASCAAAFRPANPSGGREAHLRGPRRLGHERLEAFSDPSDEPSSTATISGPPRLFKQRPHAPVDPIRAVANADRDRNQRRSCHHRTSKALRMVLHRSFMARVVRCTIRPQPGIPNTMTVPRGEQMKVQRSHVLLTLHHHHARCLSTERGFEVLKVRRRTPAGEEADIWTGRMSTASSSSRATRCLAIDQGKIGHRVEFEHDPCGHVPYGDEGPIQGGQPSKPQPSPPASSSGPLYGVPEGVLRCASAAGLIAITCAPCIVDPGCTRGVHASVSNGGRGKVGTCSVLPVQPR